MPVNAGNLKHRVQFLRREAGTGSLGQRTGDWEPLTTRWAEVIQQPGRELATARQQFEQTSLLIRIRKPAKLTLTSADRFTHRGATYEIGAIWDADQEGTDLFIAAAGVA